MNTIVDKLLEMDHQAKSILDSARQYHEKTLQETEAEKEQIDRSYEQQAQRKIKQVQDQTEQETARALDEIQGRTGRLVASMEELYEQNSAAWRSLLLDKTLGR